MIIPTVQDDGHPVKTTDATGSEIPSDPAVAIIAELTGTAVRPTVQLPGNVIQSLIAESKLQSKESSPVRSELQLVGDIEAVLAAPALPGATTGDGATKAAVAGEPPVSAGPPTVPARPNTPAVATPRIGAVVASATPENPTEASSGPISLASVPTDITNPAQDPQAKAEPARQANSEPTIAVPAVHESAGASPTPSSTVVVDGGTPPNSQPTPLPVPPVAEQSTASTDLGLGTHGLKPHTAEPGQSGTSKRNAATSPAPGISAGNTPAPIQNSSGMTQNPSGMAQNPSRMAHIGGLLTLGIPDFKLEKDIVRRRVALMAEEGITFSTGVNVGVDYSVDALLADYAAVCLTCGSTEARDLPVPGRELDGIHLAMEYLTQQNRVIAGEEIDPTDRITAEGKSVVILGGGDTGADCLGTAHRHGAEVVYQMELLPEPPAERQTGNPWPQWPSIQRTTPAHEEGGIRDYNVLTKSFSGENGKVQRLHAVRIDWSQPGANGRPEMREVPDSEFVVEADLVLLAMGFLHPEQEGLLANLGVALDGRGNIQVDGEKMTSIPGVFAGGDAARGQSLVVWAIAEGREMGRGVDKYLMGKTSLPHSLVTG